MKKLFFTIFTLIFITYASSQVVTIDYILKTKINTLKKVNLPTENVLILKTEYGKSNFEDIDIVKELNHKIIEKIELIYTQNIDSKDFAQKDLNLTRLKYLYHKIPNIFNNNLIKWQITCQNGAPTIEDAKNYFHGFIIHFKPIDLSEKLLSTDEEIEFIEKALSECEVKVGDTVETLIDIVSKCDYKYKIVIKSDTFYKILEGNNKNLFTQIFPSKIKTIKYFDDLKRNQLIEYYSNKPEIKDFYTIRGAVDTVLLETSFSKIKKIKIPNTYIPKLKFKAQKGITYTKKSIWNRKQKREKITIKDTLYIKQDTNYIITETGCHLISKKRYIKITNTFFKDTIVLKTLSKNYDWKNTIIIEDLTGSMYPYLTQTFLWRRKMMEAKTISKFIFFNDGDNKLDHEKIIGETGGIYSIESDNIDSVETKAKECMRGGNGGDGPENNLEATLKAIQKYKKHTYFMIADNYAPIKDLSILYKINKPINIILCGVQENIQSDYLTLARKTGGSIYTLQDEILNISNLIEGEIVEIGHQKFIITKGRFVLIH